MSATLAQALASTLADAVTTAIDGGGAAGTLAVYTGTKPDTVEDAATGTLLATFTLPDPVATAAVDGVATWNLATAVTTGTVAGGTPGWFRVSDSTGAAVFDGTVGEGEDLVFDVTVWVAGATVALTGGTTTQRTQ